jgi:hypothetical protein
MLELVRVSGTSLRVIPRYRPPLLYLDTWALLETAGREEWQARLRRLLESGRGTIVISLVQLVEVSRTSDSDCAAVQRFLESVSPNFVFFDPRPRTSIRAEQRLERGLPGGAGPFSPELLMSAIRGSTWPPGLTVLFQELRMSAASERIERAVYRLSRFSSKLLVEARRRMFTDPKYRRRISRVPPVRPMPVGTGFLLQELWRGLVRDTRTMPSRNDWLDFAHTVVPVSYCDAVLLDAGWAHRARVAVRRLKSAGATFESARIYDRRNIAAFWSDVEAGGKGEAERGLTPG